MNKGLVIKAACAAAFLCASGAAQAKCGGSGDFGTWKSTWWTWYTAGGNNGDDCLDVPARNTAVAKWDLRDRGNDAVGGIGKQNGVYNATFSYNFEYFWTGNKNKAFGTLYGWSCNDPTGAPGQYATPQEYYIVENYDGSSYTPFGSSGPAYNFKANGATYDVHIVKRPSTPTWCSASNREFYQYWSVRRQKSFRGTISTRAHFDSWSSNNRGFRLGGIGKGYQVMGVEGLNDSNGGAKWTVSH